MEGARTTGEVDVLVVDDSDSFRELLRDLVAATPGMTCVGAAASGEEALELAERSSPHFVIMDKRMPGLGGIATARQIHVTRPGTVVVLVSVERPEPEVLERSRAAAFVHKQTLSPRKLRELWEEHGPG